MLLNILIGKTLFSQESCFISTGNQLFTVDLANCTSQFIGTTGPVLTDIALTPSGSLYGISFFDFYKINSSTGSTTLISNIDTFGSGFNSLVGYNDEYVLAVRANTGLYKIHTATGDTTLIGFIGYGPAGDITRYKDYYYMAESSNKLIRFKLDIENSIISNIEVVGTMNTADNAVYGVITVGDANCEENDLKMIAFEGFTIYTVDPTNANCTVLCPSSSGINAFGAASAVETKPQILDGELKIPNIFTPNNDGINDYFEPVILHGISELRVDILNRWGNLVYSNSAVTNFKWNGLTNDNQMCSEGIYFYKIFYTDYCNKESIVTGFIQLVNN
ncbi:MAG: gliding motility-associated C-terminal domain-containing protein [Fluviicola sp.]